MTGRWNGCHRYVTRYTRPTESVARLVCCPSPSPLNLCSPSMPSTMSPPIVECLAASLSSDPNVRMTAELKINELLPNSGTHPLWSAFY